MKRRMVIDGNGKVLGETRIFESQTEMDLQKKIDALTAERNLLQERLSNVRSELLWFRTALTGADRNRVESILAKFNLPEDIE